MLAVPKGHERSCTGAYCPQENRGAAYVWGPLWEGGHSPPAVSLQHLLLAMGLLRGGTGARPSCCVATGTGASVQLFF